MRRTLKALSALISTLALTLVAGPAWAGVHYTAETTTEGAGRGQTMEVEGWVDGPGAKIVFRKSGSPVLSEGQYVVTKDGGKTLFLVDPKEKTYVEWDLEAMLQGAANVMQAMSGMVDVQVDNVEVADQGSEPGPQIHGLATTHRKYKVSYDMNVKVIGMKRSNHVETVSEVWSTEDLSDLALGVWLRKAPATGFGDLDQLIEAETSQVRGFPLKTVQTSTTTGNRGKSQTSTSVTEVTALERSVSIDPATFEVPAGYQRDEGMVPGQPGEEEGGNPFKGLFGRGKG